MDCTFSVIVLSIPICFLFYCEAKLRDFPLPGSIPGTSGLKSSTVNPFDKETTTFAKISNHYTLQTQPNSHDSEARTANLGSTEANSKSPSGWSFSYSK